MNSSQDVLSDRLVRENQEFSDLADEHKSCEERLSKLNARNFLSDEEKVEAVKLKKRKLVIKDRMAEIERDFSEGSGTRAAN